MQQETQGQTPNVNRQSVKQLDYMAIGLSSRIGRQGRSHIVMLDIDNFYKLESVIEVAKSLIDEYMLSDGYILQSSNKHWHIIYLDRLTFPDVSTIVEPYVDKDWLEMSKQRREFVLRCSPRVCYTEKHIEKKDRIDFVTIVISPYQNTHIKSNAHRLALKRIYDIHIDRKGHFDNNTSTKMVAYAMSQDENIAPNV